MCQRGKALIKNGLFFIGGRDLIHQFLAFAYVFPYDKASVPGF